MTHIAFGENGILRSGATGGIGLADYVITKNGTVTQSVNTATGVITYSGTNAATVFQSTINALKAAGGLVGFKGKHELTEGITIYNGVGLMGQGPQVQPTEGEVSILKASEAVTGPIITVEQAAGDPKTFTSFADFVLAGTHPQTGQHGILFKEGGGEVLDAYLDHVLVFDTGGSGVAIQNTTVKIWIESCYFEHCQGHGILSGPEATTKHASTMRVSNCYIYANKKFGIYSEYGDRVFIHNNHIWLNEEGGAKLFLPPNAPVLVEGNSFRENGGAAHPVVLIRGTSATYHGEFLISGNEFEDERAEGSKALHFVSTATNTQCKGAIQANLFKGNHASELPVTIEAAEANAMIVRGNRGFNDTWGKLANPFDKTTKSMGLEGTESAPERAAQEYVLRSCDLYLSITGGEGVRLTTKDAAGNTFQNEVATFVGALFVGMKLIVEYNAGHAPTVVASVI
jgi:hypothetical protein